MALDFLSRLWIQQRTTIPPLPSTTDLSSKTVLLTGGSAGLGYECALQLLQAKTGRLIFPVRNLSKGEAARQKLLNDPIVKSKNPHAKIELFHLEMEDFESVAALPDALRQAEIYQIDIAVLNAGVRKEKMTITKAGHEGTLTVNHLSTILLSILLLPHLRAASKPRYPSTLTIVNSSIHDLGTPALTKELSQPNIHTSLSSRTPAAYDPGEYYKISKLINMFISRELAARVSADEVIVNTVNPGFCKSDLTREINPVLVAIAKPAFLVMQRSTRDGARCYCQAAVSGGKETHGRFWDNNGLVE